MEGSISGPCQVEGAHRQGGRRCQVMHTTLSEIRSHNPCADGWATLTGALGPDCGDDTPLTYARILETNGIDDCMWALHYCGDTEGQKIMRLFAADCAERALSLYGGEVDPRSWAAVDVVASSVPTGSIA